MRTFVERFPSVGHSADAKPVAVPWLVDSILLRGKVTAVLGPEKSGKSRFICFMLAHMLGSPDGGVVLKGDDGKPWCGHGGIKKVLYLNAEEMEVDVQARINQYALAVGYVPRDDWPITYVPAAGMELQNAQERQGLERAYLQSGEYDVVVLDPLRRVHLGDEDSNSGMAPLNNDIRRWNQKYGATWMLVHHSPKFSEFADMERIATWSRGNSDLATMVDGAICLNNCGGSQGQQVRTVKRMGRFPPQEDISLLDDGDPKGFRVRL